MVIKISIIRNIYDSKVFEECLRYNLKNKDIDKILIISDFSINIKNDKIIYKIDKNVNDLDAFEYVKKLYPTKNIILSHPYIKINEDFIKLQKNIKYVNNFIEIIPFNYKFEKEYDFNIDILIKNIKKEVLVTNIKKIDEIVTIIVSYNYIDILSKTYFINNKVLDNIYIITDPSDESTINFCLSNNIKYLTFNILEDGILNKSTAINLAIEYLKPKSYVLLLDSDIIIEKPIDIKILRKENIYSANRIIYSNFEDFKSKNKSYKLNESIGLGFFQLFHISKFSGYPTSLAGRFSESLWSDKLFSSYFTKIKILHDVIHIGDINKKWDVKEHKKENLKVNVFVGIAAIPSREDSLRIVIDSLINQVDNIGVYLNGWGDYIPQYLNNKKIKIIKSEENGDYGDAGKFYWVDDFDGYYFSCDDDIIYPSNYIERTINKINFYNKKTVIGFHGSVILPEFTSYYDSKSRWVLSFKHKRGKDEFVHILGTGTTGFHTSTLNVKFSDFKTANIADMYFALLGQKQKVPFIVQEHELDEMKPIVVEESLSRSGMYNIDNKLNTTEIQNELIKSINWTINKIDTFNRKFKILMIGRFDTYKKGGIYKSNNNMKNIFEKLGHNVVSIDSMQEDFKVPSNIDLCIVYPGDLSRPDFEQAEKKMYHVLNKGIPCCINMSYLNDDTKTKKSVEQFKKYLKYKGKIYFLTFTEDVKLDPLLEEIKDLIIPFPKTISLDISDKLPSFEEREGILIGDVAKLQNNLIINGNAQEWIDAIKLKLPDVNIYAYKQYGTKTDLNNLELIPYTTDGFSDLISKVRLSVCINQKATFEMLPVESQLVGTPVIYRDMPQSLNQWIGFSGICVNNLTEISEFTNWLYTDKNYWTKYSNLSILNAEKNKIDNLEIAFDTALKKIMINSRN